jgi:uncharacterized membrane protein
MWYRHKVERDLRRWQDAGWVSQEGAAAIRADVAAHAPALGAAAILAILGAVLFAVAAMSFVAAHWNSLPKLVRLLLLLALLWGLYGAAAVLFQKGLAGFAHAAVLAGIGVYGAAIMLIAQMYHMEGHAPDAVLLWTLGALLAGVLVRSNPALAITFVLMTVWTLAERSLTHAPHWSFLAVWGAGTAAVAWQRWRPGLHLAALALTVWIVPLGFLVLDHHAHWLIASIGCALAVLMAAAGPAVDRRLDVSRPIFAYALAVAFAGLFIMQFIDEGAGSAFAWLFGDAFRGSVWRLVLFGVLTLILLFAALLWSLRIDHRGALWLAYAAFAMEVIALYLRTIGNLLNTSLFFLVAAVIVSALAAIAYWLHQRRSVAQGVSA